MKKLIALFLCLILALPAFALADDQVEITLWTYPIGSWGNAETVDGIIKDFNAVHPEIKVTVQYLDYQSGDDQVTTAIEAKTTPDIIMEGPERLVANWGAAGKMLDISDLWADTKDDIIAASAAVEAACKNSEGVYYEYPLCMTTHCMVINYNDFEKAGALQYIDEEKHTWTTEGFLNALDALNAAGFAPTAVVYCGGQGGDQGTRELVKHVNGGSMTNPEHTEYLWNSEENIQALKTLYDCEALEFDPGIAGGDEIALFYNGTLNVAFCWNAAQQTNPNTANTGAGLTANGDEILFMAFPADDVADIRLGCQNYGFGIFDNGDPARVAAAKEFIKYFCAGEGAPAAVRATNNFPADTTITGTYAGHEAEAILNEYNATMLPLAADYYQVTTGWAEARTNWWNMLQEVGASDGSIEAITEIVNARCDAANGK